MPWTQFWDMHSGGDLKEKPYHMIYIEAPKDEARVIFYNRFGHNPERVSCTCCGEDYSVSEEPTLEQLTGYHRGCRNQTLADYCRNDDVLVIHAGEIAPSERQGSVPKQGYIWHD